MARCVVVCLALTGCARPAYLGVSSASLRVAGPPSATAPAASALVVVNGIVEAPASLLTTASGTYHLQDALPLVPVRGAGVTIVDQNGQAVANNLKTDAQGNFSFQGLKPANAVWIVQATFQSANASQVAACALQAPVAAATLNIRLNAASTLAAKKLMALFQAGVSFQSLDLRALPTFIQQLSAGLDSQTMLAAYSQTPPQAAATLDAWVSSHTALQIPAQQVFGGAEGSNSIGNGYGGNGPGRQQTAPVGGNVGDAANNQGDVSTFSGSGVAGHLDGNAPLAEFSAPVGIAADTSGNVYVSESSKYIRKVDVAGNVTTLAGNGVAGLVDGPGVAAEFRGPVGLTVDTSGNLYLGDCGGSHAIRKVAPNGWVSTIAGGSVAGCVDGPASVAKFSSPTDVALVASGGLVVTDRGNNRIRRINLALAPTDPNFVTTLAGNGTPGYVDGVASNAEFIAPTSLCADASGNIYIWDRGNARIRLLSNGMVSTIAGNGTYGTLQGNGTSAEIGNSVGITEDPNGNLFISDQADNVIQKIDPAHNVTVFSGNGTPGNLNGSAAAAEFLVLQFITSDLQGNLYVPDGNNVIRKIR